MNKTLRLIDYSVSEAIESIRRNGYAGLAVVSTTAFTLCILWSFVMVSVAAAGYTDRQVDRFEISVFMKVDSTLEDAEALANKIKALPGVGKVTLKQKEEEWENFKIKHSYLVAGGLPIDTLPYAMSVQPKSPEDTVSVAEAIRKLQGIDAVFERQEFYTKILAISKVIKWAGLIGAAVLMRPSRSAQDMDLKSLKKKFKDKRFAAGCSRDVIQQGAELMGIELDQLLSDTLDAYKACEADLNEACEAENV